MSETLEWLRRTLEDYNALALVAHQRTQPVAIAATRECCRIADKAARLYALWLQGPPSNELVRTTRRFRRQVEHY